MKLTEKQRWRIRVVRIAASRVAGTTTGVLRLGHKRTHAVVDLIGRNKTRYLVPRTRSAECKLDGRSMNVRRFDRMDTFTRQVVQLSAPVFIAKPVPTLP